MTTLSVRGALAIVLAACVMPAAIAQRAAAPIPLTQGTTVGKPVFDMGDTMRGGNGQAIAGIERASREMLAVHIHAHLALFVDGQQIAIPAAIGIVRPFRERNGFVDEGNGFYWLHTHDATGVVHIESPDARPYTLGNFFDIWGEPLTRTTVARFTGAVQAFVDGRPYRGDPRAIVFAPHMQITLEVGRPIVTPPVYVFPPGL